MSDWIPISEWAGSQGLAAPGMVFELRNREGEIMFSAASGTAPAVPFDWLSPPELFRLVREPAPRRSGPIPPPGG